MHNENNMQIPPLTDATFAINEKTELQSEIDALVAMPLLRYEREYKDAAKRLGMRAAVLDSEVKAARSDESGNSKEMFPVVKAWPSPVDMAELLSELSEAFRRYAVLPKHADTALALWCVFTWFCESSHIAPLLVIRSPEKGCGKSTVMNILARLVYRPLILSGLSAAVLFRVVDKYQPTVMIDEGDTFLNNENYELHGVINSGYSKTAPYHWRCVGDNHEPKAFNVFSPKAIAFIGHTRDTLHDRAIEVELRRKLQDEKIARLRQSDGGELDVIARKLARLSADRLDDFSAQRPMLPEALPDRQADNWEPLLQVAMLAGDEWIQRATEAALLLTASKAENAQASVGIELLTDIQQIFQASNTTRIRSIDLVRLLCEDNDTAWAVYNRGKPITPKQLSKRLSEFGIKSKSLRIANFGVQKCFDVEWFADAFARYLHPTGFEVAQLHLNNNMASDVTDASAVTVTPAATVTPESCKNMECAPVTAKLPFSEDDECEVEL